MMIKRAAEKDGRTDGRTDGGREEGVERRKYVGRAVKASGQGFVGL